MRVSEYEYTDRHYTVDHGPSIGPRPQAVTPLLRTQRATLLWIQCAARAGPAIYKTCCRHGYVLDMPSIELH